MPVKFRAIKPTKPIMDVSRIEPALAYQLNDFVREIEDRMATYPPQQPTTYKRTFTLSRSWSMTPAYRKGSTLVAVVGSNKYIAPYAKWVEGEEQTREMARRGWPKVMEVATGLWPQAAARIKAILVKAGG